MAVPMLTATRVSLLFLAIVVLHQAIESSYTRTIPSSINKTRIARKNSAELPVKETVFPRKTLGEAGLGKGQFSDALSCGGKNRVAKCGRKRRQPGFTNSRRWHIARNDVDVRFPRRIVHPRHLRSEEHTSELQSPCNLV